MYEAGVGVVNLDVWKDGRGVVSRMRVPGDAPGTDIPRDPAALYVIGMLRRAALLSTAAAIAAWAGAIQLVRMGSLLIGLGVSLVAVGASALVVIFLTGWRFPLRRGEFVTLDAGAVEAFREAADVATRDLGEKPAADDLQEAERRLWSLACRLSAQDSS
jgi:hypothetical protein